MSTSEDFFRWFNHASVRLGFTVLNGTNGNNDFRDVTRLGDSLLIDAFDLLRYQNINLDFYLSIFAAEAKMINTIFHFSGGVDFHRSGLREIAESPGRDTIKEFNVFSSAPYFKILAQYRPDLNFGADLQYEIKSLSLQNNSNDNPFVFLSDGLIKEGEVVFTSLKKNRQIIHSFELDLYGQVGGKSGVFARVGIDATGFSWRDNIFPRITVGYSTNLDSYINSVNKK